MRVKLDKRSDGRTVRKVLSYHANNNEFDGIILLKSQWKV